MLTLLTLFASHVRLDKCSTFSNNSYNDCFIFPDLTLVILIAFVSGENVTSPRS